MRHRANLSYVGEVVEFAFCSAKKWQAWQIATLLEASLDNSTYIVFMLLIDIDIVQNHNIKIVISYTNAWEMLENKVSLWVFSLLLMHMGVLYTFYVGIWV